MHRATRNHARVFCVGHSSGTAAPHHDRRIGAGGERAAEERLHARMRLAGKLALHLGRRHADGDLRAETKVARVVVGVVDAGHLALVHELRGLVRHRRCEDAVQGMPLLL